MKKSRIRIRGIDRAIMMLCRDARRRWLQYGENRKGLEEKCARCSKKGVEIDHVIPLGKRPRQFDEYMINWLKRMFYGTCVILCKKCHIKKTKRERKERQVK